MAKHGRVPVMFRHIPAVTINRRSAWARRCWYMEFGTSSHPACRGCNCHDFHVCVCFGEDDQDTLTLFNLWNFFLNSMSANVDLVCIPLLWKRAITDHTHTHTHIYICIYIDEYCLKLSTFSVAPGTQCQHVPTAEIHDVAISWAHPPQWQVGKVPWKSARNLGWGELWRASIWSQKWDIDRNGMVSEWNYVHLTFPLI